MGEHVAGENGRKYAHCYFQNHLFLNVNMSFSKQTRGVHPVSGQRRRPMTNINTTLNQCLVFCWFGIWSTFTVCMFLQDIHDAQE